MVDRARLAEHNRLQCEYYAGPEKRGMRVTGTPYLLRHVERLVAVAGLRADQDILEVGCGQGRYTLTLLERGFRVTGLDLSPVLLARLRAAAGEREVELVEADVVDAADHLGRRFDRVVGFFTLHHMHDFDRVFRGMAEVLRPGGRLALLEPVGLNPLYYIQMAITPRMTWKGDGGMLRMRRSLVLPAMRRQGFVDCDLHSFGLFPPFATNTALGRRVEDALQDRWWMRPARAFQIFTARWPG